MVALNSTDEWGCDGEVSVELDTADAATGNHTFVTDDGENTVAEEDELVEPVAPLTPWPTEETATPTETGSLTTALGVARQPPRPSPGRNPRLAVRASVRSSRCRRVAVGDLFDKERLAAESGRSRCGSSVSGPAVGDSRQFLLIDESAFDARNAGNRKTPDDPLPQNSRESASSSRVRRRRRSLRLRWRYIP